MGRGDILTTFTSYGAVAGMRQAEIIQGLAARPKVSGDALADTAAVIEKR